MVFGLFKKTDPICGMKEEKGKGISLQGKWFCSKVCVKKYEKQKPQNHGCCGRH